MMGRLKSDQGQLFYEFRLGDAVPEDHLVRKIDTALDLSWLRSELAPHYWLKTDSCAAASRSYSIPWSARSNMEVGIVRMSTARRQGHDKM
ncbi:hypothetical protein CQ12_40915 [Bradyrhizobium jicamae]|uniref:Uncharacterized protein n=1 Tax=Bradyrhizobium jicamae TaxID=280332 RepID=A0A0R3LKL1_9BRAD|nr:hypothetical protein [Bradyrhizobium jicamae]KRR08295.1 hypothetical protein CQ12_40915 [Bradyrhizobium jicamae]